MPEAVIRSTALSEQTEQVGEIGVPEDAITGAVGVKVDCTW